MSGRLDERVASWRRISARLEKDIDDIQTSTRKITSRGGGSRRSMSERMRRRARLPGQPD
jgi:hypothetical protein